MRTWFEATAQPRKRRWHGPRIGRDIRDVSLADAVESCGSPGFISSSCFRKSRSGKC